MMTHPEPSATTLPAQGPGIEVSGSEGFIEWLRGTGSSLAISTYHSSRLFLIGLKAPDRLSVFQRVFERAMGIAARPERLLLSTRHQLWQLDNVLRQEETEGPFDRIYKPHRSWTTGALDIHDIGFGPDGQPIFVNTLFSCLATTDDKHSFRPLWRPPFVSQLAPEDRCHLNGLALEDGVPKFVTAAAVSDRAGGWRDQRAKGGVIVHVESGEIVSKDLSMPHAPRFHDGRLWLLQSGTGELGTVDLATGRFEPVCFLPGYLRGLAFFRGFALVGMSRCRKERTFAGLPLEGRLGDRGAEARCGMAVVDLSTGTFVHWLELSGGIRELYDVQVLEGVRCPKAVGLKTQEIWGMVTYEEEGRAFRHTARQRDEP